jgi:hypothetical protein
MAPSYAEYEIRGYFTEYLPAMAPSSNMGVQLEVLSNRRGSRVQRDPESAISEHAVAAAAKARAVEKRLARVPASVRDVLRAAYEEPPTARWIEEWGWLVRETGLPLALLGLAAQDVQVTTAMLTRWKAAATLHEKRERSEGLQRLRGRAIELRNRALDAWEHAGREAPARGEAPAPQDAPDQAPRGSTRSTRRQVNEGDLAALDALLGAGMRVA